MSSIEIMMKICETCAHKDHRHQICPYVWEKVMEAERKEE